MASRTGGLCSSAALASAQNGARLRQDVKSKKIIFAPEINFLPAGSWQEKVSFMSEVYANMYKSKSSHTCLAEARAAALGETVSLLALYANRY